MTASRHSMSRTLFVRRESAQAMLSMFALMRCLEKEGIRNMEDYELPVFLLQSQVIKPGREGRVEHYLNHFCETINHLLVLDLDWYLKTQAA